MKKYLICVSFFAAVCLFFISYTKSTLYIDNVEAICGSSPTVIRESKNGKWTKYNVYNPSSKGCDIEYWSITDNSRNRQRCQNTGTVDKSRVVNVCWKKLGE
ncbi:MAG: hypothetical protein MJY71_01590 [Bacteroidaceae bacterium]|nr:hypothetical protein [Bacteroidaceae bacterium]